MQRLHANQWFHRLAVSTVCVAMVTLIFGALTTSKNAGMAFRDWPTSDGYAMVTYPWLQDFAKDWDKFLEHGHRLAGMLIGIWSIALMTVAFWTRQSSQLKRLSVLVLLGVICQGLLGGFRVQLDERGLAMMHGAFAAIVFSLMGSVIVLSGRHWLAPEQETDRNTMLMMTILSVIIVALLSTQYLLGGLIRHQGTALHEHLGLGIASMALIFVNFTYCGFSTSGWLRHSAMILVLMTLGQVGLGAGAWVFKFGFSATGFVAVSDSIQQVSLRTAHTVWGIVTFQAAVLHLVRVLRVASVSEFSRPEAIIIRQADKSGLIVGGGPE